MEKYTIKAGEHYSTGPMGLASRTLFGWHFGREAKVKVRFDPSCLHGNNDPLDAFDEDKDRHKVWGLSESFSGPHRDSARFGWVEDGDKIRLYTYVYSRGKKLKDKPIISVPAGQDYVLRLKRGSSFWTFTVETPAGVVIGSNVVFVSEYRGWGIFHLLYPYYGGDYPAKIDTHIYLGKI